MGNKNAKIECQLGDVKESTLDELMNNAQKSQQRLSIVLANFTSTIKFQMSIKVDLRQKQLWITKSIIQLYFRHNLGQKCHFYFSYLIAFLKKMIQKKSMILINSEEWRLCFALSQFVMLCSDTYIRQFMNQGNKIKFLENQQIQQDMKILLQSKLQKIRQFEEEISSNQIQIGEAKNILRDFIYSCYTMKNKFASEFYTNFTRIYGSVESLLTLYLKLEDDLANRQHLRRNTYIGAYTLGVGIEYDHPAVINLAIKFLFSALKNHKYPQLNKNGTQKFDAIPKGYFKQMPTFSCKNVFQTITTYLLFILCAQLNQINSTITVALVRLMLTNFSPKNKQVTYLIQKLCQTKNLGKAQSQAILQILEGYSHSSLQKTEKIRKFISAHDAKISFKDIEQQVSSQQINSHKNEEKNLKQISFMHISSQTNRKQIDKLCHEILVTRLMPNAQISLNYLSSQKPLYQLMLQKAQIVSQTRSNYPETVTQILPKKQKNLEQRKFAVLQYQQNSDN